MLHQTTKSSFSSPSPPLLHLLLFIFSHSSTVTTVKTFSQVFNGVVVYTSRSWARSGVPNYCMKMSSLSLQLQSSLKRQKLCSAPEAFPAA